MTLSTTTSRVQPLLDDEEEEAEGGLRRITGADTSGDRDDEDEALPPVGGSIGVVSHPDGYQYVVKARLAVTVHALLDVVETSNTFSATVELGLEWEVSEDQWDWGRSDRWERPPTPGSRPTTPMSPGSRPTTPGSRPATPGNRIVRDIP